MTIKYEKIEDDVEYPIGGIANYYGGLMIRKFQDKHFWSIVDHSECEWEPISKELFIALLEES